MIFLYSIFASFITAAEHYRNSYSVISTYSRVSNAIMRARTYRFIFFIIVTILIIRTNALELHSTKCSGECVTNTGRLSTAKTTNTFPLSDTATTPVPVSESKKTEISIWAIVEMVTLVACIFGFGGFLFAYNRKHKFYRVPVTSAGIFEI